MQADHVIDNVLAWNQATARSQDMVFCLNCRRAQSLAPRFGTFGLWITFPGIAEGRYEFEAAHEKLSLVSSYRRIAVFKECQMPPSCVSHVLQRFVGLQTTLTLTVSALRRAAMLALKLNDPVPIPIGLPLRLHCAKRPCSTHHSASYLSTPCKTPQYCR